MNHRSLISVVLLSALVVFCFQAAQHAPANEQDAELYRLFVDALEHVDRSYVKEVDRKELMQAAINGMLESLDPYSNFISEDDWKQFNRQTTGKFGGIGIQIHVRDGFLTVISPLVGTPAYEAGVLAGDRILEVEGRDVSDLALNQVVDLLTGDPGTQVNLTMQHAPYKGAPYKITLTRAIINIESVLGDTHATNDKWNFLLQTPSHKVGYIRINSFVENTAKDVETAVKELLDKEKMEALIIDLRYNPGGLLSAAIQVSDLFVEEGMIVSTKGRNTEPKEFKAVKKGTFPNFPIVVLVNHYSASASEIVSACLQDHKRATIIGERTWGKGSVQNVIELEGGKSALKLTTAAYNRPSGHPIHRFKDSKDEDEWGVKPDEGFAVEFSTQQHQQYFQWRQQRDRVVGKGQGGQVPKSEDEKITDFADTQLQTAVELLIATLDKKPYKPSATKATTAKAPESKETPVEAPTNN